MARTLAINKICLLLATGLFLVTAAWAQTAAATPSPALLVLEKDSRTLAIVDPATLKIVARVSAGDDPHEVSVSADGTTAYITNYGAFATPLHTISVVDLVAQKPLPAIELGGLRAPHGIQTVGDKIYFTAEGSKAIARYDPALDKVDWILGVGENRDHMLFVTADEQRIFTSDVNSDTISIFERDKDADVSGWRQTLIPVGKGPEGFAVSPDGKELWAANSHDGTVSIIDVATRKVIHNFDLHTKFANRVHFTPDGSRVLITDLGTGDLIVVDAHSRKEFKRISLGHGAAGILIPPGGSRAFVAVSRDNYIAVVDLATLAVTGRIETGKGPDGMAWAVRH
jgi:YVTN family beta-propeller protein